MRVPLHPSTMSSEPPTTNTLADRMKQYELASETTLPTTSPLILRLDGHNFSRFTAHPHFSRPFDQRIHDAMVSTCTDLLLTFFPRASVAYTQSDEITVVFPEGGVQLFNDRVQKLSSLAASYCTVRFNAHLAAALVRGSGLGFGPGGDDAIFGTAHFDARFFAVPSVEEALNCLLWRCRGDAIRNSISAFARTMFSAAEMHGRTSAELVSMMRRERNIIYEERVPRWALEGSIIKRELYQHEGRNPQTGQLMTTTRTRTRIEDRGVKEFSTENLRIVTTRFWNDLDFPEPPRLPRPAIPGPAVSRELSREIHIPREMPRETSGEMSREIPTHVHRHVDNSSIFTANTTIFGPNVYVFDPSMPASEIQGRATAIFKEMEANEFGKERYAILFKPGTYNVLFDVGFYTQVAGLGQTPDDVLIEGGVNVPAYWMPNRNATCNFWRAYENFSVNASDATNKTTTIAVSQAAPLRRMHVRSEGGLWLFQVDPSTGAGGWASGGFMADSVVDNQVLPGSQQQWLSRNNRYGSWANAVWNMVFVGDSSPPSQDNFPASAYTTIDQTPIIREKPYLRITGQGQYEVFVPALQTNTRGPSWVDGSSTPGKAIPIEQFHIAHPSTANAASINSALDSGKHIILTPGVYKLDNTLRVSRPDTIVLGLGLPSLIPVNGQPVLSVGDVDGVTLAGLIIDASEINSPTLVEVGPPNSSADHASNPTFLYDLTVRTAGHTKNDVGITINSRNVIGDQLWLWRADHGDGATWETNPTRNGVVVNGDNVTIYGLFNEHHKEYQTLWNGNGGRLYFYQSEIPYDPPNQESWMSRGKNGIANGYASYKVADTVTTHEAWGLGIYSYFRDSPSKLENAIEVPEVEGVRLHHLTNVWLTGMSGSEITHIVNGLGDRVYANKPESAMRQTMKEFSGGRRA
ncbi:glycoside hydrolase family 55 protein [Hypoxylon fragiforme]|uniref:glycoside hydrolase family 55 protein n=1 Tax=Hypoxylon fragiforme TaxID=63214 RepID=UPI0020C71958|nr:glycoside hydrolase family 55 protein [Hypoxylon fragiforme]KAI2610761.1 glycoside hydrolase family 55 protein [Hypoxylon fragiforme]